MKRSIVLALCFLLLLVFANVGCTCNLTNDCELHGCGYTYWDMQYEMFECMCPGECDRYVPKPEYELAVEGDDYTKPVISVKRRSIDSGELTVRMMVKSDFSLNMEICVMQDGVVLATYSHVEQMKNGKHLDLTVPLTFTKYKPEGGDVYYVLNRFEAQKATGSTSQTQQTYNDPYYNDPYYNDSYYYD